ncbi:MAG: hypothetical protein ACLQRH_17630 [Acidimicrobiales bacterium]
MLEEKAAHRTPYRALGDAFVRRWVRVPRGGVFTARIASVIGAGNGASAAAIHVLERHFDPTRMGAEGTRSMGTIVTTQTLQTIH